MSAGNNRLYCGNDYLHLGDDYLRTEDDRRCRIDNRVRQGNGLCSMTMIADAARIIVPEAEKTESLTELIAEEMGILVSPSSTIADDMEMIVKETQLIGTTVLSKGKTGGMEAAETRVSDVKQPGCLVWLVVFPSMPAYKACGVPFLTR